MIAGKWLSGLLLLPLLSCAAAASPAEDPGPRAAGVRLIMDQADAALAVLAAGDAATEAQWSALWRSEGYRRLKQREAAMGRAFQDSVFRAFLRGDSLRARERMLRATVDSWRTADIATSAARALAYLPESSVIRARLYPVIKPQTNSFVFELNTDSAAIFMYVDPAVSRAKLENTLAHELHHVGYAAACPRADPDAYSAPVWQVRRWTGAFGEGLAMLAAAGGTDTHPHAVSDAAERARWERDYAAAPIDLKRIEDFFEDVLAERFVGDDITRRAMTFFGDAQGPWYTVGYMMTASIERALGREVLIGAICDPVRLLETYNRAAAMLGGPLPTWSVTLLQQLGARG